MVWLKGLGYVVLGLTLGALLTWGVVELVPPLPKLDPKLEKLHLMHREKMGRLQILEDEKNEAKKRGDTARMDAIDAEQEAIGKQYWERAQKIKSGERAD